MILGRTGFGRHNRDAGILEFTSVGRHSISSALVVLGQVCASARARVAVCAQAVARVAVDATSQARMTVSATSRTQVAVDAGGRAFVAVDAEGKVPSC